MIGTAVPPQPQHATSHPEQPALVKSGGRFPITTTRELTYRTACPHEDVGCGSRYIIASFLKIQANPASHLQISHPTVSTTDALKCPLVFDPIQ